ACTLVVCPGPALLPYTTLFRSIQGQGDVLQRRAGELAAQVLAPAGHLEAAVGRAQQRDLDAALLQQRHPGTVRAEPRPAAAAEGNRKSTRLNSSHVKISYAVFR